VRLVYQFAVFGRGDPGFYNECLLTENQRDLFDVVLVSPRNPLNIGAVARAMANFGFAHLSVVAPFAAHWREAKSAVGAPDLLINANEAPTLAEALARCTLAIGTGTLAHRSAKQRVLQLPMLAPRVLDALEAGGRVALIFGSEKHGLTREDLSYCHLLVEIPTDPRQPSMNLGQAVAVCLYELARNNPRNEARHPNPEQVGQIKQIKSMVTSAELDRLAGVIVEAMAASDYSPRAMGKANQHDLRLILRRLQFGRTDVRRGLGLFRRILQRLQNPKCLDP
jgi:TrmH family RNA methyltransferase